MEPDPDEHLHPGEEGLVWSEEHEQKTKGKNPKARFGKFAEQARGMISGEQICALFCGGKRCKYCNPELWPSDKMVIKGIYSNWITENIIAMSRPSDELIDKYNVIGQFKEMGVRTIINMQTQGEHADCGYGVQATSGFSYNPQRFMENNIYFYNFCWPDYGVGALSSILDMVKVMQFAVSEGKVAVHCHAGLGRTGVMIATYLVFTNRISANKAIHYIRSQRQNSIQTGGQIEIIQEFEAYLKPFRIVFASKAKDTHEFTLQHFLNRQKHILHGYEARKLKFVPKVIYVTCERLLELAHLGNSLSRFIQSSNQEVHKETLKDMPEPENAVAGLPRNASKSSLDELCTTSTTENVVPRKNKQAVARTWSFSMEDLKDEKLMSLHVPDENQSDSSSRNLSPDISLEGERDLGEDETRTKSATKSLIPADVAAELGAVSYSEEVYRKADKHETDLNEKDNAWTELSKENDPAVVSLILWEWLDQLKEPILRTQDLKSILQYKDDPETALQKLEKGSRNTIMYIVKVLEKLKPVSDDVEAKINEKLLSYLTHKWVSITDPMNTTESWAMSTRDSGDDRENERDHWGEMKVPMAFKLDQFFKKLCDYVKNTDSTVQTSRS